MANQRISAMPSGAPAQANDAVLINRSGTNYRVTAASIGGTFKNLPSWQAVQASNFTAVSGYGYFVNTTSAAITMTLPAIPTPGDVIAVVDYAGTFATNNLTINTNGNTLNGASSLFKVTTNRAGLQIVYVDATQGWECFGDKSENLIVQAAFTPPAIGAPFAGGFYAGQVSTAGTGVADYYLIVAPKSTGQSSLAYKTSATDDPGATSLINGNVNTASINDAAHPAAFFCTGLTIGGYTDWYLPASREIFVCYRNLKPTTQNNTTSGGQGSNPYAVPPVGPYSAGDPAQTSVTDFQSGGTQNFDTGTPPISLLYYMSSDQLTPTAAKGFRFHDGYSDVALGKTSSNLVRAVRRVPV